MIPIATVANRRSAVINSKQVSWAALSERLSKVDTGGKDGTGWVPADIAVGPRTQERVNTVSLLVLDVEAKCKKDDHGVRHVIGPEPPAVDDMLVELGLWGWRCIVHTSHSHLDPAIMPEGEHHRYRIVFDLSRPLANEGEIVPIGLHVASLLGIADCLDTGCLESSRFFYFPRCSAERVHHFRHAVLEGDALAVDALLGDARKATEALKKSSKPRSGQSGNVIGAFNAAHDVGAILERHGYLPRGRKRWLYPASTSGMPGVRLLPGSSPDRVYSSHGDDPLNDGHAHDAFDLFRILEQGGNMTEAIKAAARICGMDTLPRQHESAAFTNGGFPQNTAFANDADTDTDTYHRNQPRPCEAMLYGLAGDVGRAAGETTEANRYAVCMAYLTFLSAAVGRDAYMAIGNTFHHARLFALHVGRSGRGRKGDAVSLVKRIRKNLCDLHSLTELGGDPIVPFVGQMHDGGLSSREGLACMIHDGYKASKAEEVPPIHDKRLWIVESEFANVLHQAKRDGNTLSAALRDAWDGMSLRPATKNNRIWASDPHIALLGAVTPGELVGLMDAKELTNGFANRFVIFWSERDRILPFPKPTSDAVLADLVERTWQVIDFAKGKYPDKQNTTLLELSPGASELYAKLYRGELNRMGDGPRMDALLERKAPVLLRLAMLFALTDLVLIIEPRHIEAALSWIRYWRDSVMFLFSSDTPEDSDERKADGEKVLAFLHLHGEVTKTQLIKACFGGHITKQKLDGALQDLLSENPPRIEVIHSPKAGNNKRTILFRRYEIRESGESHALARYSGDFSVREIGEFDHGDDAGGLGGSPNSQPGEFP